MSVFLFVVLLIGVALLASLAVVIRSVLHQSRVDGPGANIGKSARATDRYRMRAGLFMPAARRGRNARPPQVSPATCTTLKRVCAWCGAFLGGDPRSPQITHGICPQCEAAWTAQAAPLSNTFTR